MEVSRTARILASEPADEKSPVPEPSSSPSAALPDLSMILLLSIPEICASKKVHFCAYCHILVPYWFLGQLNMFKRHL